MDVYHFNAYQKYFHELSWVFVRSVISQSDFVSSTDNLSVPQTLDYNVNPGFEKLISSTDTYHHRHHRHHRHLSPLMCHTNSFKS